MNEQDVKIENESTSATDQHDRGNIDSIVVTVFHYDKDHLEERRVNTFSECATYAQSEEVTWLDIEGVHDVKIVEEFGRIFGLHPLTIEDIAHTYQRPKIEEYSDYVYVVLKMLHYDHHHGRVTGEQVSIIVGNSYVITFQESKKGDVFDPVRKRLREGKGLLRRSGPDYLAYELIDLIVDYYLDVLEGLGEHIEVIEDELTRDPRPELIGSINRLRRQMVYLRKSIWPVRELISSMQRNESKLLSSINEYYVRDLYDHVIRTMEMIESSRDILSSMIELYLSTMSFKTNEVMRVLALISTIFLPLTFIAGIYGMNFDTQISPFNMPELEWPFGYVYSLVLMSVVAFGMILFFKKKRWL